MKTLFKNLVLPLICFCSTLFSQNIDSLAKRLPSLSGIEKIKLLDDLCYYTSLTNIVQSVSYGNQACNLAAELRDSLLLASCMNDLALSYYYGGDFDSTIILAESSYRIRLARQKWRDAGASISKSALAYYEKGKYAVSLEKDFKALELFKKSGAVIEAMKMYNNIGNIYERNNQFEEAKKMFTQAAQIALENKDDNDYIVARNNYAMALQKQGNPKGALDIYNEVLPLMLKNSRKEDLGQLYEAMGVAERELGNTKKGLEYYLQAKAIFDEVGVLSAVCINNINIGMCYTDIKKYKEADELLNLGLKQAKELGSFLWQKKAYFGLYEVEHYYRQDYKKANYYLEMYQAASDSVYNAETQNKLGRLQTEYEVQQKENTILQQKNTITEHELNIARRNTLLLVLVGAFILLALLVVFIIQRNNIRRRKAELAFQEKVQKERARISKDLHDNMGAELTIVSSLIDVQAYNTANEKDKSQLELISDQVRQASALMRDTIWTVSEEKISLAQFGIKIREFAERTLKPKNIAIHFTNTDSELNLRPELTLHLFRMVQEVINNAAKHSKAHNFYIENFVGGSFSVVLKDDGQGFDQASVERGYGLNNITSRAADIGAQLDFEIKRGEFTKVKISVTRDAIWSS